MCILYFLSLPLECKLVRAGVVCFVLFLLFISIAPLPRVELDTEHSISVHSTRKASAVKKICQRQVPQVE